MQATAKVLCPINTYASRPPNGPSTPIILLALCLLGGLALVEGYCSVHLAYTIRHAVRRICSRCQARLPISLNTSPRYIPTSQPRPSRLEEIAAYSPARPAATAYCPSLRGRLTVTRWFHPYPNEFRLGALWMPASSFVPTLSSKCHSHSQPARSSYPGHRKPAKLLAGLAHLSQWRRAVQRPASSWSLSDMQLGLASCDVQAFVNFL